MYQSSKHPHAGSTVTAIPVWTSNQSARISVSEEAMDGVNATESFAPDVNLSTLASF
jgi:hypothetical protein